MIIPNGNSSNASVASGKGHNSRIAANSTKRFMGDLGTHENLNIPAIPLMILSLSSAERSPRDPQLTVQPKLSPKLSTRDFAR